MRTIHRLWENRILRVAFVLLLITAPMVVMAEPPPAFDPGGRISQETGLTSQGDLPSVTIRVVNIALSLLGLIATVFVIYGGYMYLTAGGNDDRLKSAKEIIKNAVIGLVIVLLSYAIVSFFFGTTANVTR